MLINQFLINLLLATNQMNKDLKHFFKIIEFKNGYYFFEYNKFITKKYMLKYNYNIPKNILIIKFYNLNYERQIRPKVGINKLNDVLEINNKNTFELLSSYIANTVIKNSDIFFKKKFYTYEENLLRVKQQLLQIHCGIILEKKI